MDIDIVVLWVDGKDKKWIEEKAKYDSTVNSSTADAINRYRDWDNMKYWFRSIEKFVPWVRKIHFVTYGHVPDFLNTKSKKINIVNHKDFMPADSLPVFNSTALEVNLHRIKDLSENFIYFNDDMFLTDYLKKSDFFDLKSGLPAYSGIQDAISALGDFSEHEHILLNDLNVINKHFDKRKQMMKNLSKWINFKYKSGLIRNLSLLPWKRFTGFYNKHMPAPYLKETFEKVWIKEPDILVETTYHRFRTNRDVNQYLFRYWNIAEGTFKPINIPSRFFEIKDNNINIIGKAIIDRKYKMICLNDPSEDIDFEKCKKKLNEYLYTAFPNKSSFEI